MSTHVSIRVSTPKEMEDMSISLPCVGQAVHCHFISHVSPSPVHPDRRKGLVDKTYQAMDLLVHGESDGPTCILVEDCICKL